jgi:hypothetical protein
MNGVQEIAKINKNINKTKKETNPKNPKAIYLPYMNA